MALRLQNLFCSESEDFDDEDFLSALDSTESSSSSIHTTAVRLRPIYAKDPPVAGSSPGLAQQPAGNVPVNAEVADTASAPSLDQDLDDEELLSVCSELEVSQESYLTSASIGQTPRNGSGSNNVPAFQLRTPQSGPSPGPRTGVRGCGEVMRQPCGFQGRPGIQQPGRGRGQYPSPGPAAKRPCLPPGLEAQPVTPGRMNVSPAPTYQRCTTPTGAMAPGQVGLQNSTHPMPRTPQMSPWPHQPSTLQTPVVTNHLVQLVTAANKTPQKLAWETPPPKERRFPGPAGILPQQGSVRRLDEVLVSPHHTPSHGARAKLRSKENVPSQHSAGGEFVRGPWATMKAELSLDENDPACFLRTYSVVMVLRKAALKQLPKNKVPRMAVALKSLTPANGDASAVFRDLTGEMQGTVHHLLLEERESELKVGSVLLLQQVGVFSPSHRNHYLNVTPSNLVKIYPPAEEGVSARVPGPLTAHPEVDVNSNPSLSSRLSHSRPSQQAASSLSSSATHHDVTQPSTPHSIARVHQSSSSITPTTAAHPAASHSSTGTAYARSPGPAASRSTSSIAPSRGPDPAAPHSSSSIAPSRGPDPAAFRSSTNTGHTRGPDPSASWSSASTTHTRDPDPPASWSSTSITHNRDPDPAAYHPSSSTVHNRGPDSTYRPSSGTEHPRVPDPAASHPSYSIAHPRGPDPAPSHPSSSTIQHAAQSWTSSAADSGDWDMDDLDSFLCDLPEDPGD